MPDLTTDLHLRMLAEAHRSGKVTGDRVYGMTWGDPDVVPMLRYVRDRFLLPFAGPDKTVVEIGPGGGRWSKYLQDAVLLYAVDYHQELLDEFARSYSKSNIRPIRNNGSDLPGVPDGSVDLVWSFGVFVHLELDTIDGYLREIRRVLKPEGFAVLQYSDKTKDAAFKNKGFAVNSPDIMRSAARRRGFDILEENTSLLPHSAIMVLAPAGQYSKWHKTI